MRSAIVFGGSGFMGEYLVRSLINNGYRTVYTYHSHNPENNKDMSSDALPLFCDVKDSESVSTVFHYTKAKYGIPQVVINASGIALKQSLLADISSDAISELIQVDLLGALYISQEAAKMMHEQHSGEIIHISSLWGTIGASCEVPYSAAKGGLNSMVKALAKELAPDGIRVNAVAPGLLVSPMNSHLSESDLALFKSETPLNCYITPEDIARAVHYLIDSEHVTGQILAVDGGIVI